MGDVVVHHVDGHRLLGDWWSSFGWCHRLKVLDWQTDDFQTEVQNSGVAELIFEGKGTLEREGIEFDIRHEGRVGHHGGQSAEIGGPGGDVGRWGEPSIFEPRVEAQRIGHGESSGEEVADEVWMVVTNGEAQEGVNFDEALKVDGILGEDDTAIDVTIDRQPVLGRG